MLMTANEACKASATYEKNIESLILVQSCIQNAIGRGEFETEIPYEEIYDTYYVERELKRQGYTVSDRMYIYKPSALHIEWYSMIE